MDAMYKYKKYLDEKHEQVKVAHMNQSAVQRVSDILEVRTLEPSTGPVSVKYAPLAELLSGKSYYGALCLNEIALEDCYQRRHWIMCFI